MCDDMSFVHASEHNLLLIESDRVVIHCAITPGKNTLHVRTRVNYSAT